MSEKLDGVRAYWNGQNFYSRQGNMFKGCPDFFKAYMFPQTHQPCSFVVTILLDLIVTSRKLRWMARYRASNPLFSNGLLNLILQLWCGRGLFQKCVGIVKKFKVRSNIICLANSIV